MYSWFGRENKLLEQDLELPTFPAFIVNLVSILSINLVGRVATMWGSHTQFMIQPGKRQPGDHLKGMKPFFVSTPNYSITNSLSLSALYRLPRINALIISALKTTYLCFNFLFLFLINVLHH